MTSPPINGHEPPGLYGWRWNTINADPTLTPAQRACLNAAAHQANVATQPADPIDDAAQDAPRRDATWYRIALAAYTHLHHTGAFSHLDNPPPPAPQPCTADDDTIRAWLTSPSMLPGFEDLTVADSWGITHDFDLDDPDLMTRIPILITQAQHAGVFGVPEHTIDAYPVGVDDNYVDAHLITLRTPTGAILASDPIVPDHLLDDGLTGIDAAISILANAAVAVEELRRDWVRIANPAVNTTPDFEATTRTDTARPGRAFGALDLITPTTPPPVEPPTPPVPGPQRRR